ncbi:MAG: VWA domain-containing protein [Ilumatobacteraceae bacterium]
MRYRLTTIALLTGITLAACGSDDPAGSRPPASIPGGTAPTDPTDPTGPASTDPSGTSGTSGTSGAGRGWLDGEPEWTSTAAGEADGEIYTATASDAAGTDRAAGAPAPADGGAVEMPVDDAIAPPEAGPLRAGSVDDNADFDGYLAYLERIHSFGIPLRDFDPGGRVVVTVTGTTGLPVAGAEVIVATGGSEVARVRTTADGTARFHPASYGVADATSFAFTLGAQTVTAGPGGLAALSAEAAGGAVAPVAVDVLFLLDATGSMGDEIDRLKTSIDSVAARLSSLESAPDIRFGMTLYRDLEDTFVTSTFDFTNDVEAFRSALSDVVADGGGDYPEALDEGLAESLAAPTWRDPSSTIQLIFLVADAPPQVGRQLQGAGYPESIVAAVARGIKIFPVASSESDDQAEAVFRQLAQATGARFVFLSYGAGGAATGGNTDIDRTDYEELSLDDLVVRLVTEELAALTGDPSQVPPPPSTTSTTTIPQGQ